MSSETVTPLPEAPAPRADDTARASLQEYFALERASDVRHEYVDGVITAMAGETPTHNIIAGNLYLRFRLAFETRPCESFIESVRTRVSATKYRYPDVVALCGESQFDQEKPPSLLNPSVIVEVLSPSIKGMVRGDRFIERHSLVTLTDYVLVAQDRVEVTHYARQSERQWLVTIYENPADVLSFTSLEVSLTVADIYRKTELAA